MGIIKDAMLEKNIMAMLTDKGWACLMCDGETPTYFTFAVALYRHFQHYHKIELEEYHMKDNFIIREKDGGPF